MSVTITTTESQKLYKELVLRLNVPYEKKLERISDEDITTEAEGIISSISSESSETVLSGKEIVPYKPISSEWSVYNVAADTLGYVVSPITYTYSGISYLWNLMATENLYYVIDLCTVKGIRGTIYSTMGTVMGTVWGIHSAQFLSQHVINKTVAYGCVVMGKSALANKFLSAGAVVIVGPFVQAGAVVGGGLVGGIVWVLIGNVIYQLVYDNPIHRKIIDMWTTESRAIVEEENIELEEIDETESLEI